MGKSHLFNPFKINVFKTHGLKIFNLAQQNLSKLLCKNCAKQLKSIYRLRSYICLFFYCTIHIFSSSGDCSIQIFITHFISYYYNISINCFTLCTLYSIFWPTPISYYFFTFRGLSKIQ